MESAFNKVAGLGLEIYLKETLALPCGFDEIFKRTVLDSASWNQVMERIKVLVATIKEGEIDNSIKLNRRKDTSTSDLLKKDSNFLNFLVKYYVFSFVLHITLFDESWLTSFLAVFYWCSLLLQSFIG